MKASPADQQELLRLQEIDTDLDQLAHKETHLPQRTRLVAIDQSCRGAQDECAELDARVSDLDRDVRRVENDVETAGRRLNRDRQLLDSGTISSGKQLEDLQREVTSLSRRISELEDVQLQIMEEVEVTSAGLTKSRAQLGAWEAERERLTRELDTEVAAIEDARERAAAERGRLAADLPVDLVDLYEKVRARQGGVGAAPLTSGRCGGCHLQLPPTEAEHLRSAPPDEVVRCEECRRILIRDVD